MSLFPYVFFVIAACVIIALLLGIPWWIGAMVGGAACLALEVFV